MEPRKKKTIAVIGGVGTALNIIEHITDAILKYSAGISLLGIVIDSYEKGSLIAGIPVLGGRDQIPALLDNSEVMFLFSMYKPEMMKERYRLMESLGIPPERYTGFIHPSAYVAGSAIIGRGNIILSNATVNSNVVLGNMNIINCNVTIEHDTVVGNGNFLAAGSTTGARVKIGNHCFIGLNASLREEVSVDEVFVGMHSLVLSDFSGVTVAGVPARVLDRKAGI
ncbi:MAG: acetyltransferase [Bacteroidales bacterium]|jgi:sugar O-acyltransferase (sialic acid O-acetyltransferase NeuD family)|nr:acetyltransferase [Bacteroidales bacterium]